MRSTAALLLLPLAACAAQAPNYAYWHPEEYRATLAAQTKATPAATKPMATYVPDLIDGSYQGVAILTTAPNRDVNHWWRAPSIASAICPRTTHGVVEIASSVLTYAYNPDVIFVVPVGKDGRMLQTIGDTTFYGRVHHGSLDFNVTAPSCTTRFFGSYKLNHSY